jgi:hypothetical protein
MHLVSFQPCGMSYSAVAACYGLAQHSGEHAIGSEVQIPLMPLSVAGPQSLRARPGQKPMVRCSLKKQIV